jgi:hypothetical protein
MINVDVQIFKPAVHVNTAPEQNWCIARKLMRLRYRTERVDSVMGNSG